MLTAIIVEDEYNVGLLIKALVNWKELKINLIGILDNGKDGLDFICSSKPDIVITDIRMPKLDGLEMIQKTSDLGLHTKFIVISGYRHFEYAHNAIKYGVEDYILKPINKNELNKALIKIRNEKRYEVEQKEAKVMINQKLSKSRSVMHREFINRIVKNTDKVIDIRQANSAFATSFIDAQFQAVAIKLDRKNLEQNDVLQNNLVLDKIEKIVSVSVKPYIIEYVSSIDESLLMIFIFNFKDENRYLFSKSLGDLLHSVQDYIYAFNSYEVTMGVGCVVNQFEKLCESVATGIKAIQYRIKLGIGRKIYFSKHDFENSKDYAQLIKKIHVTIAKSVETFDSDSLRKTISDIFLTLDDNISPSRYYDIADEIVTRFFDHIIFYDFDQMHYKKNELMHLIPNVYSVTKLIDILQEKLCDLLNNYKQQQINQVNKPIRDAKRYIDEHYNEKICLEDIAKVIEFNPVYFSVIFKKETGSNFYDYLVNVRMEAAKALLRETNNTILAIAENVGYKDGKYFSQLFKKKVGINPSKYRKLYS